MLIILLGESFKYQEMKVPDPSHVADLPDRESKKAFCKHTCSAHKYQKQSVSKVGRRGIPFGKITIVIWVTQGRD
jgi:hypothetical protein